MADDMLRDADENASATTEQSRPTGSDTLVYVSNLWLRYPGDHVALAGPSFSVKRGEIFGMLGPNGGGKTTLFRILATLMKPSTGIASIGGVKVNENPAAVREKIGVVFQAPSIDPYLTVQENIMCQGHMYGMRGKPLRDRARSLLARFGLSDRAKDRAGVLSGGQRRRVELAKGMLHRPQLLLLDEPSTGLDPGARLDLWAVLEELRKRDGVTVLLTTHFMDEADRCNRIGILDRGKLVAEGEPDTLKDELGGSVVTITTRDPMRLSTDIAHEIGCKTSASDGAVRIDHATGPALLPTIAAQFADRIETMSLSKPTLEDVFIKRTGHRFWEAGEEPAEAAA